MTDDDLIRRGDASGELIRRKGYGWDTSPAAHPYDRGYIGAIDAALKDIAALPAAQPRPEVKALVEALRHILERADRGERVHVTVGIHAKARAALAAWEKAND